MPLIKRAAAAGLALLVTGAGLGTSVAGAASVPPAPLLVGYHIGPPAPDCGAMAARHGAQGMWFGAISGTRIDEFWDKRFPHYAEGCFASERTCRAWLHENLSFMNGGNLNWMRCEPGVPGRAVY